MNDRQLADKLAALDGKTRTSKRVPGLVVEFTVYGDKVAATFRRAGAVAVWDVLPGKAAKVTDLGLDYQARTAAAHFAAQLAAKLAK